MEKKVQNRLVFQHNSHIMHGYISKFGLTNLTALMIETKTIQRNSNIWVLLFSHWIMMMTRQLWLYEKKKKNAWMKTWLCNISQFLVTIPRSLFSFEIISRGKQKKKKRSHRQPRGIVCSIGLAPAASKSRGSSAPDCGGKRPEERKNLPFFSRAAQSSPTN